MICSRVELQRPGEFHTDQWYQTCHLRDVGSEAGVPDIGRDRSLSLYRVSWPHAWVTPWWQNITERLIIFLSPIYQSEIWYLLLSDWVNEVSTLRIDCWLDLRWVNIYKQILACHLKMMIHPALFECSMRINFPYKPWNKNILVQVGCCLLSHFTVCPGLMPESPRGGKRLKQISLFVPSFIRHRFDAYYFQVRTMSFSFLDLRYG